MVTKKQSLDSIIDCPCFRCLLRDPKKSSIWRCGERGETCPETCPELTEWLLKIAKQI